MSTVIPKYVIKGGPRARRSIQEFISNLENFRAIGDEVHKIVRDDHERTFKTEGGNIRAKWPRYTGSEFLYGILKKRMLGEKLGERLLRWEEGKERLYPSVVEASHPEHVWKVEGREFVFGTKVPYAYRHQLGKGTGPASLGSPQIKERRFIGLSRKGAADIRRAMARHVGI